MPTPDIDNVKCTACGSTRGVELMRFKDGAYRQCSDCELIFASPMPENLEQTNEEAFTGSLDRYAVKIRTHRRRNCRQLRRFCRYRKTGNLLEIGCNAGAALDVARSMGWNAKGVELCASASAFARTELALDVFTGTVETASFPDDYFDVVFTNAVLEHLSNPLSVLRECRRILRPGGVFYGNTVNWDSYTRRLLGVHWRYLSPAIHVHLFTPGNVVRLCERAGLEHVWTWTTGVRSTAGSSTSFRSPWYFHLLKSPLSFLARRTNKGDRIEFLARKCPPRTRKEISWANMSEQGRQFVLAHSYAMRTHGSFGPRLLKQRQPDAALARVRVLAAGRLYLNKIAQLISLRVPRGETTPTR